MENKAAKEFLETQKIDDCELQVGNVVLLSNPPQVPVKKLSQLLTDFASQQKPEISQSITRLDSLKKQLNRKFGTESYVERCEIYDIQELLKTRIQPSDQVANKFVDMDTQFNIDYPENLGDEDSEFVGSIYDVYKKAWTSAINSQPSDLQKEVDRLKKILNDLPNLLHDSLGECSKGNDYEIGTINNERWLTHKEVGSGEPLKQWIKSTINEALNK